MEAAHAVEHMQKMDLQRPRQFRVAADGGQSVNRHGVGPPGKKNRQLLLFHIISL